MKRIACTAMTKRIMLGTVNKAGNSFIGTKQDVTSDCVKSIIDMIGAGETHVVTIDGVAAFEISIKKPGETA